MTRTEIIKILKKYKKENAKKYGINSLGLFGSISRNEIKDESDVDIIIETTEVDIFIMVHIKDDLEELLKKPVDLVRNRQGMNPYLKKHIERDAIYV